MTNLRKAFTVPELLVYTVIFTLFFASVGAVFTWSGRSVEGTRRLENFQGLRRSSLNISEELSYGVSIIYPPIDSRQHHQIVFRNNRNEIVVIFLDKNSCLRLVNHERRSRGEPDGTRVLSDRAIEFSVERVDVDLVNYHVTILDERDVEFVLANSVRVRNSDINDPM